MVLRFIAETPRVDTVTVTPSGGIRLAGVPEIKVAGVLRSEIDAHLQGQLERYIRNARIEVVPLLSIGVLGAVTQPGYYLVPATATITDALMAAGGPTEEADPNGVAILRAGKERWSRTATAVAMQRQLSLLAAGAERGDVIVVRKATPPVDRAFVISLISVGVQVLFAVVTILTVAR